MPKNILQKSMEVLTNDFQIPLRKAAVHGSTAAASL